MICRGCEKEIKKSEKSYSDFHEKCLLIWNKGYETAIKSSRETNMSWGFPSLFDQIVEREIKNLG